MTSADMTIEVNEAIAAECKRLAAENADLREQKRIDLRDHFAGLALLGYMQSNSLHDQPHLWAPKMAEYAYIAADAMLLERVRTEPETTSANDQAMPQEDRRR